MTDESKRQEDDRWYIDIYIRDQYLLNTIQLNNYNNNIVNYIRIGINTHNS